MKRTHKWMFAWVVVLVLAGCAHSRQQGVSLSPQRQKYLEEQEAIRQSQSVPVVYESMGCTGHGNVGYIHSYAVQETIHGQFSRGMVNGLSCGGTVAAGYVTQEDKAEKLLAIVREARENGPQALPQYQRSVHDAYEEESRNDVNLRAMIEDRLDAEKEAVKGATDRRERLQAQAKYSKESVFRPDEQVRAAALFPVQKDEHAATIPQGIEKLARLITDTRREGGGYLLPRAFFMGDQ